VIPGTNYAAFLDAAYWRDAFAHPEQRPFLTLLLDLPTEVAIRALPRAADAFPVFPIETVPLAGTAPTAFASWQREGTHAFSFWLCEPVERRTLTDGGGLGRAVGNYYYNILPELRRPCALLWRDVRTLLLSAAAGQLKEDSAFAAAALDALDHIIAQQGFRDMLFMAERQALYPLSYRRKVFLTRTPNSAAAILGHDSRDHLPCPELLAR